MRGLELAQLLHQPVVFGVRNLRIVEHVVTVVVTVDLRAQLGRLARAGGPTSRSRARRRGGAPGARIAILAHTRDALHGERLAALVLASCRRAIGELAPRARVHRRRSRSDRPGSTANRFAREPLRIHDRRIERARLRDARGAEHRCRPCRRAGGRCRAAVPSAGGAERLAQRRRTRLGARNTRSDDDAPLDAFGQACTLSCSTRRRRDHALRKRRRPAMYRSRVARGRSGCTRRALSCATSTATSSRDRNAGLARSGSDVRWRAR